MSANNIETLRGHLFTTLAELTNTAKSPDIARAEAVCNVAQSIINVAKVEVEMSRVNKNVISDFFIADPILVQSRLNRTVPKNEGQLPNGIKSATQYTLKDE